MDNKLTTSPAPSIPLKTISSCSDTNGSTHSHLCPYFWHNSIRLCFATGVLASVSVVLMLVFPSRSDAIRCMPNLFHFSCVRIVSGALSHTLHQHSFFIFQFSVCFFGVHLFSMTFLPCDIPACMHTYTNKTLLCHSFSFTFKASSSKSIAHTFLSASACEIKKNNKRQRQNVFATNGVKHFVCYSEKSLTQFLHSFHFFCSSFISLSLGGSSVFKLSILTTPFGRLQPNEQLPLLLLLLLPQCHTHSVFCHIMQ